MNKINHKGNLPKHLGYFAGVMAQKYEAAEFWECTSVEELYKMARQGKGELTVTLDPTTTRGYGVCFDVKESPIAQISGDKFHQIVIYFRELDKSEYTELKKTMHEARNSQEEDMQRRRLNSENKRKQKSNLLKMNKINIDGIDYTKGDNNDS